MLVHRRIVLRLGAMFLLVTLKTQGVGTRSITEFGQQLQSPVLATGPEDNISKPSMDTSTFATVVPSFNVSEASKTVTLNDVSSFTVINVTNLAGRDNSTVEGSNVINSNSDIHSVSNDSVTSYTHKLFKSDNISLKGQEPTSERSSYDEYFIEESSVKNGTQLASTSQAVTKEKVNNAFDETRNNDTFLEPDISSTIRTLEQAIKAPQEIGNDGSSNVAKEKAAIKAFGEDIKKLKKNVDSFKDSFRKLLFEGDSVSSPISSEDKSSVSTNGKDNVSLTQNIDHSPIRNDNVTTAGIPRMQEKGNAVSDALTAQSSETVKTSQISAFYQGNGESSSEVSNRIQPIEFRRISAAASNISEVSRRMGAFIQKQYWDSNKGKEDKEDKLMSRGLENLVHGVEQDESELPSHQVLQQWVNLEESFRESVDAVVRQALPLLVRASSEMQLSNGCYTSFFQLLLGLRRLRPWAFQMIDAFGKPPAGMLQGTVTSFGAYDECVNIVAMADSKKRIPGQQYFRGKYCTVEIKPPLPPKPQYYTMYQPVSVLANFSNGDDNVIRQAARQAHAFYFLTYRMDICVPSTCTQEDVNNMAQFAAKYIDIEVAVPRCSVKENLELDESQVIIICIVGVLLAFVIFGTSVDTVREIFHKTKAVGRCLSNAVAKFLLSFSLNTNANLLLNTDGAQNGLNSLHGMRFFGMGWLVLGHTYFNSNVQMYGNLSEASAFAEGFLFQVIVNSTVSIDTFFFISAVLLSYLTLQSASQRGYYSIPRLFIRRLMRVLPPYMMVIGATLLLPHLGSGPFWNETVDPVVESCKQNWWTNILFINNFVTTPVQRCLEHSWYLSCDFQLFAIALFILLALIKRPALGIALNVVMIMVSMVMTGLLTYYYKVPPTLLASFPDPEERKFLNHVIISKPYCHLGPYCVGLATGYFFYTCREIKLKTYHHIIGWGSAVSVTAAVVYGVLEWNKGNLPSTPAALAYAATHRTAWALGLSWITVICVAGYGGIINRILSWKVFIPLSRLTYMVYLIHPLIQYILTGYIRERLQTNHIILAYFFFGHIMTSYALSAACFFLFDGPVEALMRLLMGDCTAPAPELAKSSAIKKVSNNNLQNEKQRNL